jgi:hypothetical protein
MKLTLRNLRPAQVCALLLAVAPAVHANTPVFGYTSRDMLLVFRKTGVDGGSTSANTLEINIGQASQYYSATPGTIIAIGQLSSTKLGTTFGSINDLSWSIGACVPAAGDSGDSSIPVKTLWVTAPRTDPNTPAPPWQRYSGTTLGGTAGQIKTILDNGVFYSGTIAGSANNTSNLVIIPVGNGHDAGANLNSVAVGISLANYKDSFQGNVENTTPSDFTTAGQPSRSDLYELRPDTSGTQPAGKYLGYFELRADGTIVFGGPSLAIPAPTLTITQSGAAKNISFMSTAGANYTLYFTDVTGLTTATSGWSYVATNILGDGSLKTFQHNPAIPNCFYRVGAH